MAQKNILSRRSTLRLAIDARPRNIVCVRPADRLRFEGIQRLVPVINRRLPEEQDTESELLPERLDQFPVGIVVVQHFRAQALWRSHGRRRRSCLCWPLRREVRLRHGSVQPGARQAHAAHRRLERVLPLAHVAKDDAGQGNAVRLQQQTTEHRRNGSWGLQLGFKLKLTEERRMAGGLRADQHLICAIVKNRHRGTLAALQQFEQEDQFLVRIVPVASQVHHCHARGRSGIQIAGEIGGDGHLVGRSQAPHRRAAEHPDDIGAPGCGIRGSADDAKLRLVEI
jgi:hypothetical protein